MYVAPFKEYIMLLFLLVYELGDLLFFKTTGYEIFIICRYMAGILPIRRQSQVTQSSTVSYEILIAKKISFKKF